MARALWAMDELNNDKEAEKDRMMMILLDEMNLARVEYYFSDFLSRLESRPRPSDVGNKSERKDAEIELEIPNMERAPRIFPGYNLLFAGTMNEDESAYSGMMRPPIPI
jgi:5-methylcytosine-specific restriction endonuclease McrBC GTP-binding regulatory subunit McrB